MEVAGVAAAVTFAGVIASAVWLVGRLSAKSIMRGSSRRGTASGRVTPLNLTAGFATLWLASGWVRARFEASEGSGVRAQRARRKPEVLSGCSGQVPGPGPLPPLKSVHGWMGQIIAGWDRFSDGLRLALEIAWRLLAAAPRNGASCRPCLAPSPVCRQRSVTLDRRRRGSPERSPRRPICYRTRARRGWHGHGISGRRP